MSQNYKDTLHLPKTDFPMKADLVKREPERLRIWEESGLYWKIQHARKDAPLFVLHDGPPFANGDVHLGTALNKVLKDLSSRAPVQRAESHRRASLPRRRCSASFTLERGAARNVHESQTFQLAEFSPSGGVFAMGRACVTPVPFTCCPLFVGSYSRIVSSQSFPLYVDSCFPHPSTVR